jgi:hypothetical protein
LEKCSTNKRNLANRGRNRGEIRDIYGKRRKKGNKKKEKIRKNWKRGN